MQKTLNLVNAPAGRRLAAWLVDQVVPVVLLAVVSAATLPAVLSATGSARQDATATATLGLLAATVVSLAYAVWLWGWQASAGKTPGHLLLGLRVTSEEGTPAGWGPILLRSVVIAASGLAPVVGPVLMLLSNLWDTNHQRQGWHDKVARTLVLDVHAGRDPLTTGGLRGPSSFAPEGLRPGDPGHPETGLAVPPASRWPAFSPAGTGVPISAVPGVTGTGAHAPAPAASAVSPVPAASAAPAPAASAASPVPAAASRPDAPAGGSAPAPGGAHGRSSSGYREDRVVLVGGAAAPADPDEDLGATRVRERPAAASAPTALRLCFDDGQSHELSGSALVGRNPAAAAGERVDLLIPFADMGRSVSKTHLHLAADPAGVWVTDRDSTNGSGITPRGGERRRLDPGRPVLAPVDSTVHFGDRSFTVSAP
ncbi:RDD family protein [Citricoccus sp. SGAir0253]|uniref:RDD family protein n=1 Tax=Citricoccus sp. SGAir0253 TaxID=2567881 RepID=UPI00143DA01D|nr:RDD family protein [Citricoccus sp. SGAir0253]